MEAILYSELWVRNNLATKVTWRLAAGEEQPHVVQPWHKCGAAILLGRPGLLLALPKQINTSKGQR